MINLRFTSGPRAGQAVQIRSALATIGRAPSCDIVLDDTMVSGTHVSLEETPAGYVVSDRQSANGTLVNGRPISRALLRIGDELVLGSTGMMVEEAGGFASTMSGKTLSEYAAGGAAPMRPGALAAAAVSARAVSQPIAQPPPITGPAILEIVGRTGVKTTPIPPGGVLIGREPACDVVLDEPGASRQHARIQIGPTGPTVIDYGSSNGTFIGASRITAKRETPFTEADVVRIEQVSMRVRAARAAPIIADVAPPEALTMREVIAEVPAPPPQLLAGALQLRSQSAAPPRVAIRVVEGDVLVERVLEPGKALTIGRAGDLVVSSTEVSGRHVEVVAIAGTVRVTDLGSSNGTTAIRRGSEDTLLPRQPCTLENGDSFRLAGKIRIQVSITTPASVTAPSVAAYAPSDSAAKAPLPAPVSVTSEGPAPHVPKALRGAHLKAVSGSRVGTALASVAIEKVITYIGRADDNDVPIDDSSVSGRHCSLTAEERGFVLRDLSSRNGTYVNNERVKEPRLLASGDLLRIGTSTLIEFSLAGAALKTLASVGRSALSNELRPRFVIRDTVLQQPRCTIGRDVTCDLFLDDPSVPRQAAEIVFESHGGVMVRSLAPAAVRLNGAVVAQSTIKTGDTLKIGERSLRLELVGARMTIHERQGVEGVNASWARDAESNAQAPVVAEAPMLSAGLGKAAVFGTMFKANKAQLAELVPERNVNRKRAPKWKATSDLVLDRTRSTAALMGVVAGGIALLAALGAAQNSAFLDGALSQGHDSEEFVKLAAEKQLAGGCESCHSPAWAKAGNTMADHCGACHDGFAPRRTTATNGKDHQSAGVHCDGCHSEHEGGERGAALVGRASCAKSGCHDSRNPPHQGLRSEEQAKNPKFIESVHVATTAAVVFPRGVKHQQDELHKRHLDLPRKCESCHTAADGLSEGKPERACFRCHSEPSVAAALNDHSKEASVCLGCHQVHDHNLIRAATVGPAWASPVRPLTSGTTAAALVIGLFLLAGGLASAYFRRRIAQVTQLTLVDSEAEKVKPSAAKGAASEGERVNDKSAVKLKVNVNLEKCVGCAMCVNACGTAVLQIVDHKSTVVNETACTSCRECESVCPSGALTMAPEGAPPRLIDSPELDPYFQSTVPGLYLIGEAAGKSLVKNAANLGRVVVEHMALTLGPGAARAKNADVDVLCVGSGPGGLSAALTAKGLGLNSIVLEKDRVFASTIQYCPKGKEFLAEPLDVKNISPLPIGDMTKEKLIDLWDEVLRREEIAIRLGEEVLDVKREGDVFVVITSKGILRALRVVLSPGTRGSPRKLGVAGQELDKVSYMLVDPEEHKHQHLLVVGGGDSAVECAMSLATQPGNVVTMSYRKEAFSRIKPRNDERIKQFIKEGKVRVIFNSVPSEVRPDEVVLKLTGKNGEEEARIPNQHVYCLLGADLPMVWLQQLGVKYVKKPEGWNPGPSDQIEVRPRHEAA